MSSNKPPSRKSGAGIEPGLKPAARSSRSAEVSALALHERVTGAASRPAAAPPESPIGAKCLFAPVARTEAAAELLPFDDARAVDAGLLSYGGPLAARLARLEAAVQPEAIFHHDRFPIQNTTDYPYGCLCYLRIWLDVGWMAYGTGWIIGKRTIITAGHCVYAYPDSQFPGLVRGWATKMEFLPGSNAPNPPQYGPFTVKAANLRSTKGWTESKKKEADYGAIILNEDLPSELGAFGFGIHSDPELHGLNFNIVGYPGDKVHGSMWGASGKLGAPSVKQLAYTIDTFEGESGSAVFYMHPTEGYAVAAGIHNYGTEGVSNYATRITTEVRDNLLVWRNEGSGL